MKQWTKEEIQNLLEVSGKMVTRSLVKLYEKQTQDEQQTESTNHHNGIGFNGVDAGILTSFVKQITNGRTLSEKQMAIARKKLKKYAGQLTKIANGAL